MPAAAAQLPGLIAVALTAVAFQADSGDALPARIKILNWGENTGRTTGKKVIVGDHTVACLSANQQALARETVALDFEHQTYPPHRNFQAPPQRVAAHGTVEAVAGEGVFFNAARYTPTGRQFAADYVDVSAVAYVGTHGEVAFIHSVALSHAGDVDGLHFDEAAALAALTPAPAHHPAPPPMEEKLRKILAALLNLDADDATDDALFEAANNEIEARNSKAESAPGDAAAMTAVLAELKELKGKMVAFEADQLAAGKRGLISAAVAEGKALPVKAEILEGMEVAALTALLDGLQPGVVPLDARQALIDPPNSGAAALTADDRAVIQSLGITEAQFAGKAST